MSVQPASPPEMRELHLSLLQNLSSTPARVRDGKTELQRAANGDNASPLLILNSWAVYGVQVDRGDHTWRLLSYCERCSIIPTTPLRPCLRLHGNHPDSGVCARLQRRLGGAGGKLSCAFPAQSQPSPVSSSANGGGGNLCLLV